MLELTVNPTEDEQASEGRIEMLADIVPVGPRRAGRQATSVAVTSGATVQVDDLSAGAWQVQITSPSGRRMVRDVVLRANEPKEVTFSDVDIALRRSRDPMSATRSDELFSLAPNAATARSLRPLGRITKPRASLVELVGTESARPAGRWASIARLIGQPARAVGDPAKLSGGASDGEWMLDPNSPAQGRPTRTALVVTTGTRTMLQSIPMPWNVVDGEAEVAISVTTTDSRLDASVRISDPAIAGVIAYLANGSLQSAADLVEKSRSLDVREMLRGKVSNPLRACAAAYVLVGSSDLSRPADWHDWLHNLANWFGGIPDSLIVLARFEQLTGRREAAARHLREALGRGLPHYTLGIVWLRDLMAMQPAGHPTQAYGAAVNKVAAHVDVSKPFTCLRWRSAR